MGFDWSVVTGNLGQLATGLWITLAIAAISLVAGAILGLVVCIIRMQRWRLPRAMARGYITIFRITPELVLIFWVYFCFPPVFDLRLSAWTSGTVALALVCGAYMAEIYRAGIESIPQGQVEAARALGLPGPVIWLKILLPQAVRRMMPAFINYLTELLKNSTLLAGIGVGELAYQAYTLGAQTYRYVELLTAVAVAFFAVIFPISLFVRHRETAMARRMNA